MALKLSTGLRNSMLDTGLGTVYDGDVLEIRSGAMPVGADDAVAGTVLASITLPADAFAAAASGEIAKLGTWEDTSADAAGTAGHFLFREAADTGVASTTAKRVYGTVTATAGGGDITLDNTSIAAGQVVTITAFKFTQPAA